MNCKYCGGEVLRPGVDVCRICDYFLSVDGDGMRGIVIKDSSGWFAGLRSGDYLCDAKTRDRVFGLLNRYTFLNRPIMAHLEWTGQLKDGIRSPKNAPPNGYKYPDYFIYRLVMAHLIHNTLQSFVITGKLVYVTKQWEEWLESRKD